MALETLLYISNEYSNDSIADLIHKTYQEELGKNQDLRNFLMMGNTGLGEYFFLNYRLDTDLKLGQLMIHRDSKVGGIPCVRISGRKHKIVVKFFEKIAYEIGGILIKDEYNASDAMVIEEMEDFDSLSFLVEKIKTKGSSYIDNSSDRDIEELKELLQELKERRIKDKSSK